MLEKIMFSCTKSTYKKPNLRIASVVTSLVILAVSLNLIKPASADLLDNVFDSSGNTKVFFRTRSGYYINCYDSRGKCQAIPTFSNNPGISDEIFTLIDLNKGTLMHGDKIMLKTRTGYYVNSYNSGGVIQAQPTYSDNPVVSDEIFIIVKVDGSSGGNQIKAGDKIMIKTRRNYAFNCYDSKGACQAIPSFNGNYHISDEVFTIDFL
ncbi:hypothetical protein [uncultured Nostoc sp.]|uniref:hypothetical protein n=1 Tax=uncultured Nostoc sp. TaxID=340711 RepID=UPI0035CC94AF